MSSTDLILTSPTPLVARYLDAVADATIAINVMMTLPPELEPLKELTQALERVIAAVIALDLPLGAAADICDAIAAGGQS